MWEAASILPQEVHCVGHWTGTLMELVLYPIAAGLWPWQAGCQVRVSF